MCFGLVYLHCHDSASETPALDTRKVSLSIAVLVELATLHAKKDCLKVEYYSGTPLNGHPSTTATLDITAKSSGPD